MPYATLQEIRDEGVTEAEAGDNRVTRLLSLATRFVDRFTGRFFEPRSLTLTLDGRGTRSQIFDIPIIDISSIRVDVGPFAPGYSDVDLSLVRVYNRHIAQNLLSPDDRESPRIEFFHGHDIYGVPQSIPINRMTIRELVFPRGQQNITVQGTFGYTDPDPGGPNEATGVTPPEINHVTKLLVLRELSPLNNVDAREDRIKRWRLKSEKTRDQSYTLDDLHLRGAFTGDPEIDTILAAFRRPAQFGAA